MTPAELRARRELLGLTAAALARILGVGLRSVQDWEQDGRRRMPAARADQIRDMCAAASTQVYRLLADGPRPLTAYRTDTDWAAASTTIGWDAASHRMMMARAADLLPGMTITYEQAASQTDPPAAR